MESPVWILEHQGSHKLYNITKSQFQAGRSNNADIVCRGSMVSRSHAVFIVLQDGTLHVKDNGSANGTYVNRERIPSHVLRQLHINDEIGLGLHSQFLSVENIFCERYIFRVRRSEPVTVLDDDDIPPATAAFVPCNVGASSRQELLNVLDSQCNDVEPDAASNVVSTIRPGNHNEKTESKQTPLDDPSTCHQKQLKQKLCKSVFTNGTLNVANNTTTDGKSGKSEPKQVPIDGALRSRQTHSPVRHSEQNLGKDCVASGTLNVDNNISAGDKNENSEREQAPEPGHSKQNMSKNVLVQPNIRFSTSHSLTVENNNKVQHIKQVEECELITGQTSPENGSTSVEVKNEPSNNVNGHDHRYTIEDGCIVIDDDDDDFPCSQLFENDICNANVDEPMGINDSIFYAIKLEVEELDRIGDGVILNPIVVDSDTEGSDWMNDLQNDENMQGDCKNTEKHCNEPCNGTELKQNEDVKNCTTTNENITWTVHDQIGKSKYVKPPVIQPHFEAKHRNCKKSSSATTGKRKSLEEEKEDGENKKIKTNYFYDQKPGKGQSSRKLPVEPITKETKAVIHNIRKRRLTEIAEKSKEPNKDANNVKSSGVKVAAAKVKVSEGRGHFLIENQAVASTSKCVKGRPSTNPIKHKTNVNSDALNNKVTSQLRQKNNILKNAKVQDSNLEIPNVPVNALQRNGIVPIHTTAVINRQPINYRDVEDILVQMVNWNPQWFQERKDHENWGVPPVNKEPLKRMAKNFGSYAEYAKVVVPLMMVELWYFLHKEITNMDADPRKRLSLAMIVDESKKHNMCTVLDCYTYISKEQNDEYQHIKEEDIVMLQYRFKSKGQFFITVSIGYVTQVNKKMLQGKDYIDQDFALALAIAPRAMISFKLMMKLSQGITLTQRWLKIKVVTSAVSTLRMFKSVKHLEHSDLCPFVLKPSADLYKLPHVSQKKLFSQDNLNSVQYQAVMEAMYMCTRNKPGVFLIQGPPGTGKTTVIINIIQQILFQDTCDSKQHAILLVAPSNGAVDELVSRLVSLKPNLSPPVAAEHRKELKIVRIGPKNIVNPTVQDYLLSEMAKRNIYLDLVKTAIPEDKKKIINSLQKLMAELKGLNMPSAQSKFAYLSRELDRVARQLMGRSYNENIKKVEETLLNGARVICTTLSSCIGIRMTEVFGGSAKKISCCIVDEATQSSEPESLIPLKLGINKMVFVGDPKQLPAVTLGKEAKDNGFGQSLFSRIRANFQDSSTVRMLNVQYRMHPEICRYPNQEFYDNQLKNAASVLKRESPLNILAPYRVFNCDIDLNNSQEYQSRSEIDCVLKLLDAIIIKLQESCNFSVGIVTPYNNQKSGISDKLKERKFKPNISVCVNTVDSFQGQEKDIIIMSCVRINSNNFLRDEQRLNVAITRAKHALYIIGSANLFRTCEVLGKIRDDAMKRHLLVNVKANTPTKTLVNFICCK